MAWLILSYSPPPSRSSNNNEQREPLPTFLKTPPTKLRGNLFAMKRGPVGTRATEQGDPQPFALKPGASPASHVMLPPSSPDIARPTRRRFDTRRHWACLALHIGVTSITQIWKDAIMCRVVTYFRVSTEGQGRSGLGLEAQREAVASLVQSRGWQTVAEFTEVESGKRNDRPELTAALHRAKVTGAVLVVAKLDRLSRNVAFLAALQESGVRFLAADMPEANELTVHIMAAVAQAERKAIGKRTREALAAAKARGTWAKADGTPYKSGRRLGNPNGAAALRRAAKGNTAAIEAVKAGATERAADYAPVIADIQASGATSLPAIARELNERGIVTPRGGQWHPSSIRNLLARLT